VRSLPTPNDIFQIFQIGSDGDSAHILDGDALKVFAKGTILHERALKNAVGWR
jgi:hypothetical protein